MLRLIPVTIARFSLLLLSLPFSLFLSLSRSLLRFFPLCEFSLPRALVAPASHHRRQPLPLLRENTLRYSQRRQLSISKAYKLPSKLRASLSNLRVRPRPSKSKAAKQVERVIYIYIHIYTRVSERASEKFRGNLKRISPRSFLVSWTKPPDKL